MKKKAGRPKKLDSEKAKYQMLAVRSKDYQVFIKVAKRKKDKIVDAFGEMVKNYSE